MAPYQVINISMGDAPVEQIEPMGTKRKFWFLRTRPKPEEYWLFKYARSSTGEDWSEKIAAELADLLGIPHAHVELASFRGHPGIVTRDFTDRGQYGQLVHGNELLAAARKGYPRDRLYHVPQHTVSAVYDALNRPFLRLPSADRSPCPYPVDVEDAPALFVGYLLLDAWIGNTDRHHENWGILVRDDRAEGSHRFELAPSFDHASSLGRELREEERVERLTTKDANRAVEAYAQSAKARSALYAEESDTKPQSTLDAVICFGQQRVKAFRSWLDRLAEVPDDAVAEILAAVPSPRMSPHAREFARRLLQCNKERLLECRNTL